MLKPSTLFCAAPSFPSPPGGRRRTFGRLRHESAHLLPAALGAQPRPWGGGPLPPYPKRRRLVARVVAGRAGQGDDMASQSPAYGNHRHPSSGLQPHRVRGRHEDVPGEPFFFLLLLWACAVGNATTSATDCSPPMHRTRRRYTSSICPQWRTMGTGACSPLAVVALTPCRPSVLQPSVDLLLGQG